MLKNVCKNFDNKVEDEKKLRQAAEEAEIEKRKSKVAQTKDIFKDATFLSLVDKIAQEYKQKQD